MMKYRVLFVLVLCIHADMASAQRIGIFFDPQAHSCRQEIHQGDAGEFWIIALLEDRQALSLVGAEFQVVGFPQDWVESQYIENGFGLGWAPWGGVRLGFKDPQSIAAGLVPLCRIAYRARSELPSTTLRVQVLSKPTNPSFTTPILVLQSSPTGCAQVPEYEAVPAQGLEAVINGECTTAVQRMSWKQWKVLYR